jgi:hypothetical protein
MNVSCVLPKLIRWGQPPGGLQVRHTLLEHKATVDDDTLNRLLPLPVGAEQELFAPDGHLVDILPWPGSFGEYAVSSIAPPALPPLDSTEPGRAPHENIEEQTDLVPPVFCSHYEDLAGAGFDTLQSGMALADPMIAEYRAYLDLIRDLTEDENGMVNPCSSY